MVAKSEASRQPVKNRLNLKSFQHIVSSFQGKNLEEQANCWF